MSVEETTTMDTVEVQIASTTLVQVMMPGGVIQVFERPIYTEVAAVGPQGTSGPPGTNGEPGPPGQSAILGTWEGTWLPTEAYPSFGMVQHLGSTYLNPQLVPSTIGVPPPTAPWELVAAAGQDVQPFKYVHNQLVPAAIWLVIHGLGGFPNVTAIDSSFKEIVGDLEYLDLNSLKITFASATGGQAFVS